MISQEEVKVLFKKTNKRKAPGLDAIGGRILYHCAERLCGIFTYLFELCVGSCKLPTTWKSSIIIPIPKVNKPKELQEFRPVALTSLVVKNFERIIKD